MKTLCLNHSYYYCQMVLISCLATSFTSAMDNLWIKPKIIDFFPFNGEPMAFFRLGYLMDVVDYFIIVESNSTHSGKPKSFLYVDKYARVLQSLNSTGKILVHKISFPSVMNRTTERKHSWEREKYQRNVGKDIVLKLMGTSHPFIMIVSDAYELPREEFVESLSRESDNGSGSFDTRSMNFVVKLFKYSFKWTHPRAYLWNQGYVINDLGIKRLKPFTLSDLRTNTVHVKLIPDRSYWWKAGWHVSWCLKTSDVIRKLKSCAHVEFQLERLYNKNWIEKCMNNGIDILTNKTLIPYKYEYGYPSCDRCKSLPGYKLLGLNKTKFQSYFTL